MMQKRKRRKGSHERDGNRRCGISERDELSVGRREMERVTPHPSETTRCTFNRPSYVVLQPPLSGRSFVAPNPPGQWFSTVEM